MQHFSRIRDKSYAYLSKNDEYDRKLISPKPLENDAQITPEKKNNNNMWKKIYF